jgi:hypothetical protein
MSKLSKQDLKRAARRMKINLDHPAPHNPTNLAQLLLICLSNFRIKTVLT